MTTNHYVVSRTERTTKDTQRREERWRAIQSCGHPLDRPARGSTPNLL